MPAQATSSTPPRAEPEPGVSGCGATGGGGGSRAGAGGGGGGAGFLARGLALVSLREVPLGAFGLPSPRRGLRAPGRLLGGFPKTPRAPAVGSESFGSEVIFRYSSGLDGRVRRCVPSGTLPVRACCTR